MAETKTEQSHFAHGQADGYDRAYGQMTGFPHTAPAGMAVGDFMGVGGVRNYTAQTFRVPEVGDTVFIVIAGPEGLQRVHLPPDVARLVGRQHDALTTQSRRRQAASAAAQRKASGKKPGFLMTEAERAEAAANRKKK